MRKHFLNVYLSLCSLYMDCLKDGNNGEKDSYLLRNPVKTFLSETKWQGCTPTLTAASRVASHSVRVEGGFDVEGWRVALRGAPGMLYHVHVYIHITRVQTEVQLVQQAAPRARRAAEPYGPRVWIVVSATNGFRRTDICVLCDFIGYRYETWRDVKATFCSEALRANFVVIDEACG